MVDLRHAHKQRTFEVRLKSNLRLTSESSDLDVRDLLFELPTDAPDLVAGDVVGLHLETDGGSHFRPYYVVDTLASPSQNLFSLCVQRCFTSETESARVKPGLSSNRLCDLEVGESLSFSGPYPSPFQLPEDPTADVLMIGIGTGIAPFGTLIKAIYGGTQMWQGRVCLFYGARSGLELLFMNDQRNDLKAYLDEPNLTSVLAIRGADQTHDGEAVSDQLVKNRELVQNLVRHPKTHIYVAGNHVLAYYLDRSFVAICGGREEWSQLKHQLEREKRWQETLY